MNTEQWGVAEGMLVEDRKTYRRPWLLILVTAPGDEAVCLVTTMS